ncbi:MAG: AAA family ATPase [Chloroflexi bacterium]|nr:AAA family ATPase [Chloroflexota bacterium]
MDDTLHDLTLLVSGRIQEEGKSAKDVLKALFGSRYYERHYAKTGLRDALKLGAGDEGDQGVPFAGLINPDNPETGPYGGTSVVWFPSRGRGSLLALVVGTRGLSPDEGILTRPGHRRRAAALRRLLGRTGVEVWSKPDPANLGAAIPKASAQRFPGFENVFKRYGHELYLIAQVPGPENADVARAVVQAFFDLYSYERGWEIFAARKTEREELLGHLRADLFPQVTADLVHDVLLARHFVVLQGPPGTGKTRLASEVLRRHYTGRGMTIQFHPAVTYEDFVVGLSPDISNQESLRFGVRPGWLCQACESANNDRFLLVIDEMNRADLGKVLGEAIYLFEPGDVGTRTVVLAHPVSGRTALSIPNNLYVLGTMNTADRTIAGVDLAIRRRFSFITMMPDRDVVAAQGLKLATDWYDRISDVFVEHAPDDALNLLPGHSYYLANDELELKKRLRYELLPLIDEYLREGYLGPATNEMSAVRNAMEDAVR